MTAMKKPRARVYGPCLNCSKRCYLRPRKLCFKCSRDPAIRAGFPTSDSSAARRGTGHMLGASRECVPTGHAPGTEGKIRVLAERARLGQQLWHPDDAKLRPNAPSAEGGDGL